MRKGGGHEVRQTIINVIDSMLTKKKMLDLLTRCRAEN